MPSEPTRPDGSGEPVAPKAQNGPSEPGEADAASSAAGLDDDAASAPPRRLRFTRRRLLIVGGAAAAGVAAAVAGLRPWGDSSSSPAGSSSGGRGGDFPVLSVEPPPDVAAEDWVHTVDGLVERPLTIGRAAWFELPRRDETADFHRVTGWTADDVRWGGVPPSVLLDQAGLQPGARYAAFHAFGHLGGGYLSSIPLDLVLACDTVLADTLDGGPLPARHGGPLRLVVPQQLGYKSVKWVVRIEVTGASEPGYWEQRGYPDDTPVGSGRRAASRSPGREHEVRRARSAWHALFQDGNSPVTGAGLATRGRP